MFAMKYKMSQQQDPINLALAKEIDYNTLVESSVTQAELLSRLLNRIESLEVHHKRTIKNNWLMALFLVAFGCTMLFMSVWYLEVEFDKWDKKEKTMNQIKSNSNFPMFRSFQQNSEKQTKLLEEILNNAKSNKSN